MEKLLTTINSNEKEVKTIDTREVAKMMDVGHNEILKKLNGTTKPDGSVKQIGIIPTLAKGNLPLSDYFIESTYKDDSGKENKCYLCTKLGCDFLANKFTGEKGILFTAKYVKRFDDMEKQLEKNVYSYMIENPIERAKQWILEQEQSRKLLAEKDEVIEELSPLASICRERMDKTETISFTDVTDTYKLKVGQVSCWAKIKGYISRSKTNKEVNQEGKEYFKTIVDTAGYKNIAIKEEGLKLIDKYIEEIKKSPCRFKMELVK